MSSRRQTTTTEAPTTPAPVVVEKGTPVWISILVGVVALVIIICFIICFIIYRKRKSASKIQPTSSTDKLDLKRDSIDSHPDAPQQQRVFSIDSIEKGETDKDMTTDAEDELHRQASRASSKGSFKAVASVARLGARITHHPGKDQTSTPDGKDESSSGEEENVDSGYGDSSLKAGDVALAAFTSGAKEKKKKKKKIDQTATMVFGAAKELYGKGQSTFKRTGGRQNSAGVQTSPTHTGSVTSISIPGLVETPDPPPESFYQTPEPRERAYFVYLISDSTGSNFRKDCIGRVQLPHGMKQVTLADLRAMMSRSDDATLRGMLRNNKSFRFVTETYKFVAQNEQAAEIDEVYGQQGIFVKFMEGSDVKLTLREGGPSPALSTRIRSRQKGGRKRSGRRRGGRHAKSDSSTDHDDLPPLKHKSRQRLAAADQQHHDVSRSDDDGKRRGSVTPMDASKGGGRDSITPDPHDPHHRRRRRLSFRGASDSSDNEYEEISERLHKRHFECISPLPVKYKEAYKRQVLLIMDSKRICDNRGCNNHALFKCARCTTAAYCSAHCKKDHYVEHRMVCKRPPWRL